jgi:hypothetical protein
MRNKQGIIVAVGVTFVAFCVPGGCFGPRGKKMRGEPNTCSIVGIIQALSDAIGRIDFVAAQGAGAGQSQSEPKSAPQPAPPPRRW